MKTNHIQSYQQKKHKIIKEENMNFIKENWLNLITVLLSLAALIFSIYSHFNNIQLQEKYDMLNTYAMTLNYQVEISETEGNLKFGDIEISKACINITPKTGGIEKIYAIHYYKNNVKPYCLLNYILKEWSMSMMHKMQAIT